jgi:hypothetical protein
MRSNNTSGGKFTGRKEVKEGVPGAFLLYLPHLLCNPLKTKKPRNSFAARRFPVYNLMKSL